MVNDVSPSDEPETTDADGPEPAAAFAVLGSETRLRILRELWESDDRPLGFSTLRARVGMRDPGQFAYHLNRLVGPYVTKSDDGYDIRMAGVNVVWAVVSGELTPGAESKTFPATGDCEDCGGPLRARYEDELFYVECADCGRGYSMAPFPPSGFVDRTEQEVLVAFDRRSRPIYEQVVHDVCPRCAGHGTVSLVDDDADRRAGEPDPSQYEALAVRFRCDVCGLWASERVDVLLTHNDRVAAFHRDNGVDLEEVPIWLRPRRVDANAELRATRPLSFRVRYTAGAATLELVADETLAIDADSMVESGDG
ncbi:hypothetical protein SAMN04487947_1292 [Halogeometricum rufum]|uniref:Helix-turn-helix domain-containing protein n=1 Tax=Halogeometricum rufum TaxID=553469 RepID=A0A1I6GKE7_9EURY|nr:winged helix-turn-helix domain-containing protein [Halogeometricum rufum]SFR42640.1 hypothetical protein SAMN04487947_1292 [Halogeometricum rufum]